MKIDLSPHQSQGFEELEVIWLKFASGHWTRDWLPEDKSILTFLCGIDPSSLEAVIIAELFPRGVYHPRVVMGPHSRVPPHA